ncbi:MAG: efflux RND transporter permease subunit [Victivallaceae bacterium]|nr:efflux RND transporter permease subunit [Victivallaceae bacterium]
MIKAILKNILGNPVLANIMMVLILVAGYLGAKSMTRETFPKFSLDIITVNVAYPGADPAEIEESICLRLEEAVEGIEGIKNIYSESSEGMGRLIVELNENASLLIAKDDIKTTVDAINTFPVDAEPPIVREIKFRGDVMALILWGDLPERQLKEAARQVKDEVVALPEISQVFISGTRDYQISIEISEENLRKYGITLNDVSRAVADNGLNIPAGTIRNAGEDFRIRVMGRRYEAKEYRDIPIIAQPDGTTITLGQIANIKDSFDDDAKVHSMFNGYPAAAVNIYKTDSEDAIKIAEEINRYLAKKHKTLPPGLHITKSRDMSRLINSRLNMLLANGRLGLLLVFITLWIFLDLRLSFWVTMGIPISIAGALVIMAATGCSLNMLSLFGLIMVLGLIVDDAIVVGESVYLQRYTNHKSPMTAALDGTAEVTLPVIAAVLTTIVAFLPLFFVPGVMGKFIRQIPIPVIAALSISLIEGLFILPVHLRHLPVKITQINYNSIWSYPTRIKQKINDTLDYFIHHQYGKFVDFALHWRYVSLCIAIVVLALVGGLIKSGIIKFKFLEKTANDFLVAKVTMAPGTPLNQVEAAAQQVMKGWDKVNSNNHNKTTVPSGENLTVGVYALIGDTIKFGETAGGSEQFEVNIELIPSEQRTIHYRKLLDQWKKIVGTIPGADKTNFKARGEGPGGMPIEFELRSNDVDQLLTASDELIQKLRTYEGVFDEQTDYTPGKREFIVKIRPQAYNLGLTLKDLAYQIQGGFYGTEALRIQRGRDDIKVKIRFPEKNGRNSISYFKRMRINVPGGARVPLTTVANIEVREGQSTIRRSERARKILVQADISDNFNSTEIMNDLMDNFIPELLIRYDVTCSTKGESQETRDSLNSLFTWFPIALFGIYMIIASMFKSYIQPAVIMTTIPFGLVGGVVGHVLFGRSISIMSLFGMVALTGIVVNDAIVLIEGINLRLSKGTPLLEALREGGKRRFRPIMLTTMTTSAGLMPLILEKSMQAQFLIPMALSIAFGVMFATVLTLVLIPCLLAILNDLRRLWHQTWNGGPLPAREAVEPRYEKSCS